MSIIARRESLGYVELPLAEGEQQSSGQLFVAFSDGMFFYCRPGDSRRAIMSVAVGDKNQNRVR